MSIKLKQRGEFEDFQCGFGGSSFAANAVNIWVIPCPVVLKGIIGRLLTAGSTNTTVDIQKNGVSLFTASTAMTFGNAATVPTYGTLASPPLASFVKGDILTVKVTAVGTSAANLAIALNLQRPKATGVVASMLFDSLGPEAEY